MIQTRTWKVTALQVLLCVVWQAYRYNYSLDGLVEDVEDGLKNTNDIGVVVAWEAGELYKRNYYIESPLLEENIGLRSYHGVTHRMRDIFTNEYVSELILFEDLILYLNNYDECMIF